MGPIGSIDYSGLINQNPESIKIVHQELTEGQQHQLAVLHEHRRDEKRDTVVETSEPEDGKIRDEGNGQSGTGYKPAKQKKDQEEDEHRYISVDDEKLGSHFDISA